MSFLAQTPVDASRRKQLITIMQRARVFDRDTNLILLNKIWFEPGMRREFSQIIKEILESLPIWSPDLVLLYPEGLLSSLGMIPFVSIAANELENRMVVWREVGDIITTTPRMLPESSSLPRDLNCIVLQDVISRGTTIQKMRRLIQKVGWTILYYIAVVKIDGNEDEIQESISECQSILSPKFQFKYLVSGSDLGSS